MKSKSKSTTTNNTFVFLSRVFICILCAGIVYLFLSINKISNKIRKYCYETFENPTLAEPDTESEANIAASTKCPDSKNLTDICINLEGCCQNSADSTDCRCKHPLIQNCADELKKCNETPGYYDKYPAIKKQKCQEQLKSCCTPYNNIPIDTAKYEKQPPQMIQPFDTKICSNNGLKFDECSKLCLTNDSCKSFRLDNLGSCILYNSFNPKSPTFGAANPASPNQAGAAAYNKASVDSNAGFYKIL